MKKALSLMLVLVLVLGMSTVAFAANTLDKSKQDDHYNEILFVGSSNVLEDNDIVVQVDDLFVQTEVITFRNFDSKYFASSGGTVSAIGTGQITEKEWKDNKIAVKIVTNKGAAAYDGFDLKWTDENYTAYTDNTGAKSIKTKLDPYIKINFKEWFKSNNPDGIAYEFKIYLTVNGSQWSKTGATVSGDYMNDENIYPVADSDKLIYSGDGRIIVADAYAKGVEFDCGKLNTKTDASVSVFAKVFKDRKYYLVVDNDFSEDEEELVDKYGIDGVYHVSQVGIASVFEYIKFNDESSDMFVYGYADGKFTYLGTGDKKITALYDTYYLATKELDIAEDDEPIDEDPSDVPQTDDGLGGDDEYPANVNDNPGTGC